MRGQGGQHSPGGGGGAAAAGARCAQLGTLRGGLGRFGIPGEGFGVSVPILGSLGQILGSWRDPWAGFFSLGPKFWGISFFPGPIRPQEPPVGSWGRKGLTAQIPNPGRNRDPSLAPAESA